MDCQSSTTFPGIFPLKLGRAFSNGKGTRWGKDGEENGLNLGKTKNRRAATFFKFISICKKVSIIMLRNSFVIWT